MWNNNEQQQGYGAPPAFPGFPSAGGFAPPPGPPPAGYSPAYGQPPPPPAGFAPPSGPPGPTFPGYGFPQAQGPPPPAGYGAPPGPPPQHTSRGFPGADWRQQSHGPPPGPPPQHGGYQSPQGGYQSPQGGYQAPQGGYQAPQAGGYRPPQGPPGGNSGYQPSYQAPHMPPTQVQNYGPHFQGPGNKDSQLNFQYSQCNGKKKALLIGINYFKQNGELKGCINDVQNVKRFLCEKWGYKNDDIVVLTDDQTAPRQRPTTANIIQAMRWLVSGASQNDSLFFHYSGHGGQTKDKDGDEGDGFDEVIYPVDFQQNGHIVDDMMHDIMVKPLPAGCRLTAIFDSCHSGSALDLPYIYSTEGKIKEPNLAAEAGQGLLSAVSSYARGDMSGVFKSAMGIVKTATGSNSKADKISKATRTSPADVISFSGCKDSQTSADTHEAGQATGAMSFAFISALTAKHDQSYQELLNNIREILRTKYSQKPQLSSSHPMDTSIFFLC